MQQKSLHTLHSEIAIITGDIIESTALKGNEWVNHMETCLRKEGEQDKDWTIFGGDAFQLKVRQPQKSIAKAIVLYAEMFGRHNIRLRQSIGIGRVEHDSERLATSNGPAFQYSGRGLERIGKQKLVVKSSSKEFDRMVQTMLALAEKIMDDWTSRMAFIFFNKMRAPEKTQKELARQLDVRQSVISESLKRSGYKEISGMLNYLESQIVDQ
jgi:hypothetical protein